MITAEQVQKLRERTGAGMMDCKKALTEQAGDFEKAIEHLRKKGIASASKKAGRTAKDGTVYSLIDTANKAAVLVEVNCETDFVAKTENYLKFVNAIATQIAKGGAKDVATLFTQTIDGTKTVEEFVKEGIATLGENINVRRFSRYAITPGKEVKSYIHAGGKVGVLVEVSLKDSAKASQEPFAGFIRDLTMHIAAASPLYLDPSKVPADVVAKEKEIALAQLAGQNKPADILEKIASGKINKYFEETCLIKQKFIKDDKKSIEALTAEIGKAIGDEIAITQFDRFVLGEGVEILPEAQ